MYQISAYFDEKSNDILQKYINAVAGETGNCFMTENRVPPHLTLAQLEARDESRLKGRFDVLRDKDLGGAVELVSIGAFLPYVLFVAPVYNDTLQRLEMNVFSAFSSLPDVKMDRHYRPGSFYPHITIGKRLAGGQMQEAFQALQKHFQPLLGYITGLGLSKTNPHRDIVRFDLTDQEKGIFMGEKDYKIMEFAAVKGDFSGTGIDIV